MGLNNIENKIRDNKTFFDEDPSANHLKKFQAKLTQIEKPKSTHKGFLFASNKSFALAASVTIILFIAIFTLLEFPSIEAKPQLSEELLHVKMYYNSQTNKKIAEIKVCAAEKTSDDMLIETTEDRLTKLDNSTQKLEQKLEQAHGNKQLESAYILSLKAKSDVVNQLYAQLCVKNSNNNFKQ